MTFTVNVIIVSQYRNNRNINAGPFIFFNDFNGIDFRADYLPDLNFALP